MMWVWLGRCLETKGFLHFQMATICFGGSEQSLAHLAQYECYSYFVVSDIKFIESERLLGSFSTWFVT